MAPHASTTPATIRRGPGLVRPMRLPAALLVVVFLSACPPMNPLRNKVRTPSKPGRAVAAPIFDHGSGAGIAAPDLEPAPQPLPPEKAIDLIVNELFYRGVRAFDRGVEVEGFYLPGRGSKVDALDREMGVAVVYVPAPLPDSPDAIRVYDLRADARALSQAADRQPARIYVAVFYDPLADPVAAELAGVEYHCADPDYSGDRLQCANEYYGREALVFAKWRENHPEVRAASRRLLALQVRDFIAWLEDQGALAKSEK